MELAAIVIERPGTELVYVHGIVHTHSRNIPVAGQGFF